MDTGKTPELPPPSNRQVLWWCHITTSTDQTLQIKTILIFKRVWTCVSVCLSPPPAVARVFGRLLSANHRQPASVLHRSQQSPTPPPARPETLLWLRKSAAAQRGHWGRRGWGQERTEGEQGKNGENGWRTEGEQGENVRRRGAEEEEMWGEHGRTERNQRSTQNQIILSWGERSKQKNPGRPQTSLMYISMNLFVFLFFSVFVCISVSQESSLQAEEQRQLNKIFLQDFCNSDYIVSPIDKHETQRSSVSAAQSCALMQGSVISVKTVGCLSFYWSATGSEAAVNLLSIDWILGVSQSLSVWRFISEEPDFTKTVWAEDRNPAADQGENINDMFLCPSHLCD